MHRRLGHGRRRVPNEKTVERELRVTEVGAPVDCREVPRRISGVCVIGVLSRSRPCARVMHERRDGSVELSLREVDLPTARPDAGVRPQQPSGLIARQRIAFECDRVAPCGQSSPEIVAARSENGFGRRDEVLAVPGVYVQIEHTVMLRTHRRAVVRPITGGVLPPVGVRRPSAFCASRERTRATRRGEVVAKDDVVTGRGGNDRVSARSVRGRYVALNPARSKRCTRVQREHGCEHRQDHGRACCRSSKALLLRAAPVHFFLPCRFVLVRGRNGLMRAL